MLRCAAVRSRVNFCQFRANPFDFCVRDGETRELELIEERERALYFRGFSSLSGSFAVLL
jgi:hypothetical protein